ncbi:MAG: hypothetical protein PSX79_12000 [bacterium]|nr:hypothetical protein [bacterium]
MNQRQRTEGDRIGRSLADIAVFWPNPDQFAAIEQPIAVTRISVENENRLVNNPAIQPLPIRTRRWAALSGGFTGARTRD